jgi:hypothetical protein
MNGWKGFVAANRTVSTKGLPVRRVHLPLPPEPESDGSRSLLTAGPQKRVSLSNEHEPRCLQPIPESKEAHRTSGIVFVVIAALFVFVVEDVLNVHD